jgi:hypothetical protein
VGSIDKAEAIEIIKNTFYHLIFEEEIKIGTGEVLLYFPTMGIAVLESSEEHSKLDIEIVQCMHEHLIRRELNAKPVYLNLEEPGFSIGFVLNEILLEGRLFPGVQQSDEGRNINQ